MKRLQSSHFYSLAITIIILIGFFLRVWGITYGLPYLYFTDEVTVVGQVLAMGYTKNPSPEHFNYPTLLMYILGLIYVVYFGIGFLLGIYQSSHDIAMAILRDPTMVYLLARLLSAVAGTATIWVTYKVGAYLFGRKVGLVAALLITPLYTLTLLSHFVKCEPLETFLATLTLLMTCYALKDGKLRQFAYAGALAGLTAAAKYGGGAVFVCVILALIMQNNWQVRFKGFVVAIAAMITAFAIAVPYAILDWQRFLGDLASLSYFRVPLLGDVNTTFWAWWPAFGRWVGYALTGLFLCGSLYGLIRHTKEDMLLLSFPLLHFGFLASSSPWKNVHWQAPIFPFLALLAGRFLVEVLARLRFESTLQDALLVVIIIVVTRYSLSATLMKDYLLTQKDTRTLAKEWVETHIPAGAKILMERGKFLSGYGPPLQESPESIRANYLSPEIDLNSEGWSYPRAKIYYELLLQATETVTPTYFIIPILYDSYGGRTNFWHREPPRSLSYYQAKGVQYVITTHDYETFKWLESQGEVTPYVQQFATFYQTLEREGKLLKEFVPEGRLGPRIYIYELPSLTRDQ